MKLIAFFSNREILSIGLLEGEPTKGPLLKTIEKIKPTHLLLITHSKERREINSLMGLFPPHIKVEELCLEGLLGEAMTPLVAALKENAEAFEEYKEAALMNYGTPQERAALWLLKHEGILKGPMVEPPTDYDFIPSPPAPFSLKIAEPVKSFDQPENLSGIDLIARKVGCIGKSARFKQTLNEAAALANHSAPILLIGETGCGKEVLAHFIHEASPRALKSFVAVNCAALPEMLAESILFGHEKGSFTGAYKRQTGKFEQADGGTLFLDEIGELSMANQAKLLRVLETRCVDRLGGHEPVSVDVRIIAATNRNLAHEVASGRFREDLYYRLRAGEIEIPPLRERPSDIPLIALHILQRFNATFANPKQFSKTALTFLETQPWTGNVRDLHNTIERAALLCPKTVIEPHDFKIHRVVVKPVGQDSGTPDPEEGFSIEEYLQKVRRELYEKALKQARGNKSAAARLLGISPQAMHKYLRSNSQTSAGAATQ